MPVRGDFARLRLLLGGLNRVAGRPFLRDVVKQMGAEALTLSQEGFNRQEDPYGTPWKPIRRRGQILRNTGRLFNSLSFRASGMSFSLIATADYAGYHQEGTGSIPARPYFPTERGYPDSWARALREIAEQALLDEVPR
jgi:phage gpG-like protein